MSQALRLYFDAETGQLLTRRTRLWRVYDFMWMLHIMDYQGREDFNHPLVQIAAGLGLSVAISGILLVVYRTSATCKAASNSTIVGISENLGARFLPVIRDDSICDWSLGSTLYRHQAHRTSFVCIAWLIVAGPLFLVDCHGRTQSVVLNCRSPLWIVLPECLPRLCGRRLWFICKLALAQRAKLQCIFLSLNLRYRVLLGIFQTHASRASYVLNAISGDLASLHAYAGSCTILFAAIARQSWHRQEAWPSARTEFFPTIWLESCSVYAVPIAAIYGGRTVRDLPTGSGKCYGFGNIRSFGMLWTPQCRNCW